MHWLLKQILKLNFAIYNADKCNKYSKLGKKTNGLIEFRLLRVWCKGVQYGLKNWKLVASVAISMTTAKKNVKK